MVEHHGTGRRSAIQPTNEGCCQEVALAERQQLRQNSCNHVRSLQFGKPFILLYQESGGSVSDTRSIVNDTRGVLPSRQPDCTLPAAEQKTTAISVTPGVSRQ